MSDNTFNTHGGKAALTIMKRRDPSTLDKQNDNAIADNAAVKAGPAKHFKITGRDCHSRVLSALSDAFPNQSGLRLASLQAKAASLRKKIQQIKKQQDT
jgi:hypothetical protein